MITTARIKVLVLLLGVAAFGACAQTSHNSGKSQPNLREEPIRFQTKAKDFCTMVVTAAAGNYTRLRVSCKSANQPTGRSYYCDFQGKPSLCRAYASNPRHYFTQMMWELRKLQNACQGAKVYRQHMCRKYSDEAQMTFLTSWPKVSAPRPGKPAHDSRSVAMAPHAKPIDTKVAKPQFQPMKPKSGKGIQSKKVSLKPTTTTTFPMTHPYNTESQQLASQYCWKSLQGICAYFISWFHE